MDELIEQLTKGLGVNPSVAKNATGRTMQALQSHLDSELFAKISAAIPGVQDVIRDSLAANRKEPQPNAEGGGLLGQLAGMASKVLGKDIAGGMELATSLTELGIPQDKLTKFVSLIINFIQQKAGDDVLQAVLAKFPMLKALLSRAG